MNQRQTSKCPRAFLTEAQKRFNRPKYGQFVEYIPDTMICIAAPQETPLWAVLNISPIVNFVFVINGEQLLPH